jgi:hypothetical protein
MDLRQISPPCQRWSLSPTRRSCCQVRLQPQTAPVEGQVSSPFVSIDFAPLTMPLAHSRPLQRRSASASPPAGGCRHTRPAAVLSRSRNQLQEAAPGRGGRPGVGEEGRRRGCSCSIAEAAKEAGKQKEYGPAAEKVSAKKVISDFLYIYFYFIFILFCFQTSVAR